MVTQTDRQTDTRRSTASDSDGDSGAGLRASGGDDASLGRRAFLATGVAAAFTSGCIEQSQSLVARSPPKRISLTVKTVPADADPVATTLARNLAQRLKTVGVDASVSLHSKEELYRDVLLNQEFDVYVARHPHTPNPDFLRPLLHSRFSGEPGWQNPFGYTNLELDEKLEAQRTAFGDTRVRLLREIESTVVRDQPFSVVAFPDEIRAVRTDAVRTPEPHSPHTALHYLAANPVELPSELDGGDVGAADEPTRVRVTLDDSRPTENLNPLAIEFRNGTNVVDTLYDPVGRRVDGDVVPWLARNWEWRVPDDGSAPTAVVDVRSGLTWHDGADLTADDVAFTYEFLRDTSLGRAESPVPAPGYRGVTSLVDDVQVRSDDRVELRFVPVDTDIAARAFTVPVLPRHEWEARSKQATIAGVETGGAVTQALVTGNLPPVGSGPLRFESATKKESLVLRRFDDHFLTETDVEGTPLEPFDDGFGFDALEFAVVPSTSAAVEFLQSGAGDVTGSPLSQSDVPRIGQTGRLGLRVTQPNAFYHVGYNARNAPTSNTRFRRAIAHLLDKRQAARDLFGGYADPAASPLARNAVHDPELAWDGADPSTPFLGTNGSLDVERAREKFRAAGYRYSKNGFLLNR